MEEIAHKSFFRTAKVLALLPLALMAAGVWYYIAKRGAADRVADSRGAAAFSLEKSAGATDGQGESYFGRKPQAAAIPVPEPAPEASLEIQGDESFKSQVTRSLKLIWLSDREDLMFIKKYLSVIRNENKTDLYVDNGRPVAALSRAQSGRSLTWCAGLIAHQAFHAYVKFNSRKRQKVRPPLPGEKSYLKAAATPTAEYTSLGEILAVEAKACAFQAEILRKIGAPRAEINALLKRAPRDFSVSHDGSYSNKP